MSKIYNKKVRFQALYVGDLVLKVARHVQTGLSASEFDPKWEGPYFIHEPFDSAYFLIARVDSKDLLERTKLSGQNCIILNVLGLNFLCIACIFSSEVYMSN